MNHFGPTHFDSTHNQPRHYRVARVGRPPGGGRPKPYRLLDPAGKELRFPYEELAVIIAAIEYYYYD